MSSGVISEILVNSGVPIFPPKNTLYSFAFKISEISVVVVVLTSLTVIPITFPGHN